MQLPFHFGANPKGFENARYNKTNQTRAEKFLWKHLRGGKLKGHKFRRQHPIENYIVDFYCQASRLVVEVDGGIHKVDDNPAYDEARTKDLEALGLSVIRFSNEEVLQNVEGVLNEILRVL